jgi:hypothetical protein
MTAREFQLQHIDWLYARLQAITRAQGRYLWLLLIGSLYTFAAHYSAGTSLKVPLLDLDVPRLLVEPFALLFLCLVALGFFGTFEAASFQHRLIAFVVGMDWRQLPVHHIDQNENVLDHLIAASSFGLKPRTLPLVMNAIVYSLPLTLAVIWMTSLWIEGVRARPYSPAWLVGLHGINGVLLLLTVVRTVAMWIERVRTYRREARIVEQVRAEFGE